MSEDTRPWTFRQGSDSTLVEAMVEVPIGKSGDIYKEEKTYSELKAGGDGDDKEIGSRSVDPESMMGGCPSDRGEGVSTYKAIASLM